MANVIYGIGSTKLDDMSVFKGSYCSSTNARVKCTKYGGGDMVVTTGKTLKIFHITISGVATTAYYGTLAYDDDGSGLNEVIIMTTPQSVDGPVGVDIYFEVPAGKYLTFKGWSASYNTIIHVAAIEV